MWGVVEDMLADLDGFAPKKRRDSAKPKKKAAASKNPKKTVAPSAELHRLETAELVALGEQGIPVDSSSALTQTQINGGCTDSQ